MTADAQTTDIRQQFERARADTLRLFALVPDEAVLRRPPAEGFRPILWHLGHIGAFEAFWVVRHLQGEPAMSDRFEAVFDPIKTPREDANNLPPRAELDEFLAVTRGRLFDYLARAESTDAWPILHMVLEHELQHQETLYYLLHLLDPSLKQRPGDRAEPMPAVSIGRGTVEVPEGSFEMGSTGYPFAYDNEQPPHRVEVPRFRIDRAPVTNGEYAGFVESGGYAIPEVWSEEAWAWREAGSVEHPHSWIPGRSWSLRGLFEHRPLDPHEPVWGVSWYEADAYARWAGRRLPTEAEWEKAARGPAARRFPWGDAEADASRGNFDDRREGPTPVGSYPAGASPYGCLDMAGNIWEWTASIFDAYPGFRAFPYPEYSELWFDGDHRIARGGSWVTRRPILRSSFRNFFRRNFRIGFIGFRCAD